jgi:hypothetical protein
MGWKLLCLFSRRDATTCLGTRLGRLDFVMRTSALIVRHSELPAPSCPKNGPVDSAWEDADRAALALRMPSVLVLIVCMRSHVPIVRLRGRMLEERTSAAAIMTKGRMDNGRPSPEARVDLPELMPAEVISVPITIGGVRGDLHADAR